MELKDLYGKYFKCKLSGFNNISREIEGRLSIKGDKLQLNFNEYEGKYDNDSVDFGYDRVWTTSIWESLLTTGTNYFGNITEFKIIEKDMKKFKNHIAIKFESPALAEAMMQTLEEKGYTRSETFEYGITKSCSYILTYFGNQNGRIGYNESNAGFTTYSIPEQWNEAIEAASEIDKEDFEIGDYFILTTHAQGWDHKPNILYKITGVDEEIVYSNVGKIYKNKIRKAIEEEIENHLITEAEKQGWYNGVYFTHPFLKGKTSKATVILLYQGVSSQKSQLCIDYHKINKYFLCVKGVIGCYPLDECTIVNVPEIKVIVNDSTYVAEFTENGIHFNNCAKFDKEDLIALYDTMIKIRLNDENYSNRVLHSVKWGKAEFTFEQLEQIANYYKK